MDWTVFDRSYVLGAAPLCEQVPIASLLAAVPALAEKLDETIEIVREDWRLALQQAGNALDADETKLPNTCLRYAYLVVEYELARMVNGYVVDGVTYAWTPNLSTLIRAEVYRRAIVETKMKLEGGSLSPSYNADTLPIDRALPDSSGELPPARTTATNANRTYYTAAQIDALIDAILNIPAGKRLVVDSQGNISTEDA